MSATMLVERSLSYFSSHNFAASANVILFINTCNDNYLEVTRWIYKGTWDLLSLLQHSGKL